MRKASDIPANTAGRRLWLFDLGVFFFRRKFLGHKVPLLASFKLTYRCNLSCNACPFHHRAQEPGAHMTWNTAVAALEELQRLGCRIIMFEGGEPFLWRDGNRGLYDLVCFARQRFLRVGLTTNGTFALDVPADVIWVSLDGLPETHDSLRSNSFKKLWENLEEARGHKILIHYTLNRKNWVDLEAVLKKLQEVPAVKGVTVQLFYPYGQGEEDLALTAEQRREALANVLRLKKEGYPVLNSRNRLRAMVENRWVCHDDLLINVDPDGTITPGCYVKSRGKVVCSCCGFTPVAEASAALDLKPGALYAGWKTFISAAR